MLNLLIAIIFSAIIPILLKSAHKKHLSEAVILSFNYIIATFISVLTAMFTYIKSQSISLDKSTLIQLIIIGIFTGLMFYGAFFFFQKSVRKNGVSITTAVGKMGIIIPMLLSMVIWQEIPTGFQWVGIIISLLAIAIINIQVDQIRGSHISMVLFLFFIMGGLGDFGNKYFEMVVGQEHSSLFLALVFASALIASLPMTLKEKAPSKESIFFGIAIGIPNMLTAYFLIAALATVKAAVAFPLYSGGAIVLSMSYSVLRFKEHLKKKDIIGIIMILLALVMINLVST